MLFSDSYTQAKGVSQAQFRERGSRFLAFATEVKSEDEIRIKLHELRSQYPDATHHCYAYVLHPDKSAQRANDDGEPGNSAGKPILRAILSSDITNILVVVVRYFGGTRLGIAGLIEAYGLVASMALSTLGREEKFVEEAFTVSADFAHEQEIHRLITRFSARVLESEYTDRVTYRLAVRSSLAVGFRKAVAEYYQLKMPEVKK